LTVISCCSPFVHSSILRSSSSSSNDTGKGRGGWWPLR
jgi:hypothetical protein